MLADNFYWYASVAIFLPWLLLIVAPRWRYSETVAFVYALVLGVAAAIFTFAYLGGGTAGNLFSLDGLANLFRSKEMLLTGWLNYLAFSLLVGTWQVHDARLEKIPHYLVAPCLVLTLVAGPAGLLLYLVLRFFKTRSWNIK
jgi:hypothetical protein